jgi:hypothetical protein
LLVVRPACIVFSVFIQLRVDFENVLAHVEYCNVGHQSQK